jgi:hypothetical protein
MEVSVDKDLLLEFFLAFSRFEYALKTTGLFKKHAPKPGRRAKAEPDWDSFAVSLRQSFNAHGSEQLQRACDYLLTSPPNQQVIIEDGVGWETPMRAAEESDVEFLLRMVRSVRNNLFHGDKYKIGVHEDRQRTETLLRSSLEVLSACLMLAPVQGAAYADASL